MDAAMDAAMNVRDDGRDRGHRDEGTIEMSRPALDATLFPPSLHRSGGKKVGWNFIHSFGILTRRALDRT